ncbi:MAG TPA: dihydrodipicolinate synthase family protein [bacterium]|nr:dihydrodipicolinate synthase family protein [bacterium]HRU33395.1 dihydrodipicolinate synthase family protein [bacterium]
MLRLKGTIPAVLTPFDENYEIDENGFQELCEYLIENKVSGLFVAGTTGEGPLLSLEERARLFKLVVKISNGRVPVICHTGSISLTETSLLIRSAIEAGADAVGIVTPYYYRLDEKAMEEYYSKVLEKIKGFPVFLYNIPGLTNNYMSSSLAEKLFSQGKIAGIKDSSGNITTLKSFIDISPDIQVISGADELFLLALTLGAVGAVSSTANVFPEVFNNIYNAFLSRDMDVAIENQRKLNQLCKIFQYGKLISAYKYALYLKGLKISRVRLPQRELTEEEKSMMQEELKKL